MSKVNLFFIRGLFLVVCWFCSNTINAYDFEVDGLYYGINRVDKTAVFVTEGNNKYQGDITIPQSVVFEGKEYKVKSIDNVAFYQCYSLNSIKLPDGLQSISQFAFYQCSALSRIEIPNSVNSIGLSAFEGCGNLSYVKLPISISTINDMVFYKCSKLSSIIIPEGVTSIGSGAFYACSSLSSVSIPTSVVNIGDGAFNSCRELTNIEFPPNLESIGASAFLNCSKIETLTIPANLKFIGNNAFKGCSILTLVKSYIETPFTIDDTVFKGISSFAKLEVPKGTKAKYQALSGWITCFKEIVEMDGATATASGLCGDNVTWNYYDSDNKLVIGGTGEMYDYSNGNYPWYSYRANIKTVVIEEGITHIGNGSFFSCKKLDSVTIPNSVSSIGSFAFTDCVSITALTVPNSVNSIGDYAFRNCNALTSITISKNVKTIGAANPWAGCNLSTISVDKSNPIYDSRDNCNAIIKTSTKELIAGCNSTTVPYGITSIGGSAFSGCDRLTSLVIPTSVTSIGNSAFINCSSLTSITIPNGVTSIGSQAFQSCSGLASITIPNSMTSIGGSAFSQCYNLVLVKSYIENPFNLDSYVFYQISSSAKLEVPNGTKNKYQVSGWSNYFKEIVEFGNSTTYNLSITSSGNGSVSYSGTTIRSKTSSFTLNAGSSATITFSPDNGYRIKSVKVNNTTVSVPNNQYTISNISQDISVEVEFMIDSAANKFEVDGLNYNILSSNTVELTWKGIREPYIGDIVIPDNVSYNGIVYNVVRIGDNAFQNVLSVSESGHARVSAYNSELSSIKFPSTLISIGQDAFSGCSGITSITFPSSLTSIEGGAFSGCSGLTSITIPCALTSIGEINVFYDCSNLTSITVESNNKRYDSRNNCNAIIETSTNRLIIGCKNSVIPNTVTTIGGGAFSHCSGLASITIPSSVTKIEDAAFLQCFDLTSIIIPNSVTTIGKDAFSYCSALTSITIPNSVTSIGNYAFYNCSSLTYVKSIINPPFTIENDVFSGISSTAKLEVPKGTKSQYQTISGWAKYFKEIVEFDNTRTYTLSITAFGGGSASYGGTTIRNKTSSFTVNAGSSATITFSPDNGYRIKSVKENNTVVTSYVSNGIYTINSLSRNTTVEVEFEEILQAFSADDVNYTVVSVDERTIRLAKGSYGITLEVPAKVNYQNAEWTVIGIDNGALANNPDLAAIVWNPDVAFTEQVSNPNLLLYVNQTQYAPSSIKNVVVNGNANSITLTDAASGNNFHCPQAFTAQKISYTHNYSMKTGIGEAKGWETIALPFDVQKVTHESKGEIVSFANWRSGDSKRPFWLMQLSGNGWTMATSIKASTPYIISMPYNDEYKAGFLLNGRVTFSAENVNVAKTENLSTVNYSDRTFIPTFSSMEKNNDVLALNVVNDIERVTGGSTEGSTFERNLRPVHPFEAYMTSTSSTRSIGIDEGMATGIIELISALSDEGDLRIYNLNGQLIKIEEGRSLDEVMRELPAGVYIVNGKKMIIR